MSTFKNCINSSNTRSFNFCNFKLLQIYKKNLLDLKKEILQEQQQSQCDPTSVGEEVGCRMYADLTPTLG